MLLTEYGHVVVEATFATPPAAVWQVITDVSRIAEWSPECVFMEWADDEHRGVGARFFGYNKRGDDDWYSLATIIESESERRFAWTVGEPDTPDAIWRYELHAESGGRHTRVVHRIDVLDHEPDMLQRRLDDLRVNMLVTLASIQRAASAPESRLTAESKST